MLFDAFGGLVRNNCHSPSKHELSVQAGILLIVKIGSRVFGIIFKFNISYWLGPHRENLIVSHCFGF